jgi:hypothetical protein
MTKLYDGRKRTGYSSEEAYFHEENKRLIQELRKKNNREVDAPPIEGGTVIDASDRFAERRSQAAGKSRSKERGNKKAA